MANDFMLAYRGALLDAPTGSQPARDVQEHRLEVTVLFTGLDYTLRALKVAARLAHDLNAHIRLIVPQVVPYPLPLESPPVLLEFNEHRFRELAEAQHIETQVDIFLCRDAEELLEEILPAHSSVVIGGRRRWWPSAEQRMARRLHRNGYGTIFVGDNAQLEEHAHA